MTNESKVVDTLVVRQDVGGPYPRYKKVILQFREDGSVTWVAPDGGNVNDHDTYIGEKR